MASLLGCICIKTASSEYGRRCVVVEDDGSTLVLVTGPKTLTGVRRRAASRRHLNPTGQRVEIPPGASDEQVLEALLAAGVIDAMGLRQRREVDHAKWKEAIRLCGLTAATLEMAHELGMNPRDLIKNRPSAQEPWKMPVNDWIRELHRKKRRG